MGIDKNAAESNGKQGGLILKITPSPDEGPGKIPLVGEISIGRAMDNRIVILDLQVSKHHAKVTVQDDACQIVDLDSRNGTIVNGVKIGGGKPVSLEEGDVIGIGHCELTLMAGGGTAAAGKTPRRAIIRSIPSRNLIDEFIENLSDDMRLIFEKLTDSRPTRSSVTKFCLAHFAHPRETVALQNMFIAEHAVDENGQLNREKILASMIEAAIVLNASLEELGRPSASRSEDVNLDNYEVVENAEYLIHGDILPSRLGRLEDVATHDYRELLVAYKHDAGLMEMLLQARKIGIVSGAGQQAREVAVAVEGLLKRLYSSKRDKKLFAGQMKTLGYYAKNGGSCRHKAATLQLMLQEAGLRSRYTRGMLMGGGQHAWVELCSGEQEFDILIDPHLDNIGRITSRHSMGYWGGAPIISLTLDNAQESAEQRNTGYIREEELFNIIWRPRIGPSMAQHQ